MGGENEFATRALLGGNKWRSSRGSLSLGVEPVYPGDTGIRVWIADPMDGPAMFLSPDEIRAVAADWLARADLIEEDGTVSHQ